MFWEIVTSVGSLVCIYFNINLQKICFEKKSLAVKNNFILLHFKMSLSQNKKNR